MAVSLPLTQVHSLAVLGGGGGLLPPPPLLPEPPPQPDVSRAIETSNRKGIFPGNGISATFQTAKSVCAKYSAKANPIMDGWQGTSVRRPASGSGSCAAPGTGGRSTLPSSPASMKFISQTWSAAHASRVCEPLARSPLHWAQRSQNCSRDCNADRPHRKYLQGPENESAGSL